MDGDVGNAVSGLRIHLCKQINKRCEVEDFEIIVEIIAFRNGIGDTGEDNSNGITG